MANDLDLPLIPDALSAGQWEAANNSVTALANAVQDNYAVDFSAGAVTLTASQFRSAVRFTPSGLTANRALTIAAVKRPFFIVDNTDATYTITVTKGSTTIAVAPGRIGFLSTDGTTNSLDGIVLNKGVLSQSGTYYDFGFSFSDTPIASQVLGRVQIGRNITIPANMSGASGGVAVNATSTFAVDVMDDGVSIGTISVATGGTVTFSTTSGTAKSVAAGSEIRFVAPASPDATVEGGRFVILATVA